VVIAYACDVWIGPFFQGPTHVLFFQSTPYMLFFQSMSLSLFFQSVTLLSECCPLHSISYFSTVTLFSVFSVCIALMSVPYLTFFLYRKSHPQDYSTGGAFAYLALPCIAHRPQ
jgi:hypothetical protein